MKRLVFGLIAATAVGVATAQPAARATGIEPQDESGLTTRQRQEIVNAATRAGARSVATSTSSWRIAVSTSARSRCRRSSS